MKSNVFVGLKPAVGAGADYKKSGDNYDYILHPITNSRYRERVKKVFQEYRAEVDRNVTLWVPEPQLQELCIPPSTSKEDSPSFIGLLSSWVDLESTDTCVRELSYQVLINEWNYAKFVGIKQLILAPPKNLANLHCYALMVARLLLKCDAESPVLSISLPFFEDTDPLSTWELWGTIRKTCGYHPSLTISLALPRDRTPSYVLQRWLAEPVTCLLVSSSIFATNQYNYPVLNKFNQQIIFEFQKINGNSQARLSELCVILHGIEKYAAQVKGGEPAYLEYVNYLLKRGDKVLAAESVSTPGKYSEPRIMPPLDPYSDEISNAVYHTFEQDRVKYELYGRAIKEALKEMKINRMAGASALNSAPVTILIAGAGRGPLVDEAFKAVKELNIQNCHMVALEKSSQAILYLQKRKYEYWKDAVEIVKDDMCTWQSSIKIDLCVSELLGSFGCNELSPECLSNIERNNCKKGTVFIPQSYSSFLAPISSPLLYQTLKNLDVPDPFEKPWIVHSIPYCIISTKINEAWCFQHPPATINDQLTKSVVTDFKIKNKCEVHGLMGFFKATLYGDIGLSIVPDDSTIKLIGDTDFIPDSEKRSSGLYVKGEHTPNMTSWSPIIFPLKQPLFIPDDTELEVFMTRNHSSVNRKFWYEWSVSSYVYLVMSDRSPPSRRPINKPPVQSGYEETSQDNGFYSSPPAIGVERAFERFRPSPNYLSEHGISGFDEESEAFEGAESESGFLGHQQSGWKSVNDIHGLGIKNPPVFDLHSPLGHSASGDHSAAEEYHVRVKTGVSELHNVGGRFNNISLR
ncbi:protein arginine N-methyltransferase [Lachancea thermotolerans CBS 6340]|uniref:KLTH0F11242p n=1 Tax=Lachancea thermotolerans (strain ATCC 56472 / CBS 6340 / NRRL Y-8284) TaxID=559295 RepID=C5DL99_LACTC|nr:KLTH0F11242p [Lachancea thermotolerans CBS 6340]CAR24250.1 KLTH0F11242p [Lachancea thermotolerans CBS 6340]